MNNHRIQALDFFRGFALLGIFMVNLPLMVQPFSLIFIEDHSFVVSTDYYTKICIQLFFEGKFFVIFSFLFGAGFYFFLQNKKETAQNLYNRRLIFLFGIGVLHISFLWVGDILLFYSLMGFLLLLFRRKSNTFILRSIVIFLALPALFSFSLYGLFEILKSFPDIKNEMEKSMQLDWEQSKERVSYLFEVYSHGPYVESIQCRWSEYIDLLLGIFFFYPVSFAMFLLGYLGARNSFFQNIDRYYQKFKPYFFVLLIAALSLNILYVFTYFNSSLQDLNLYTAISSSVHGIAGVSLASCYLFLIYSHCIKYERFSILLSQTGRMALTNYLSQSLIIFCLTAPWGLGLYGKINFIQGFWIVLSIYGIQILVSAVWLQYFEYGPMEWIWRMFTMNRYIKLKK